MKDEMVRPKLKTGRCCDIRTLSPNILRGFVRKVIKTSPYAGMFFETAGLFCSDVPSAAGRTPADEVTFAGEGCKMLFDRIDVGAGIFGC